MSIEYMFEITYSTDCKDGKIMIVLACTADDAIAIFNDYVSDNELSWELEYIDIVHGRVYV